MEIRLLTPGDSETFRALRLEALKECPTAFTADYETNLRRPLSHFAAQIQSDPDSFMVGAFRNADLVAMAGFYRNKSPKLRHRGNIWSVYVASDLSARTLYLNSGFEIVGRAPRAVHVDGQYFDEDLLVLPLK